jgi:hypothetical protein
MVNVIYSPPPRILQSQHDLCRSDHFVVIFAVTLPLQLLQLPPTVLQTPLTTHYPLVTHDSLPREDSLPSRKDAAGAAAHRAEP